MRCKLTGLPLHRDIDPALVSEQSLALFIDIDGLIWLNDDRGFAVADDAIVKVANVVREAVKPVPDSRVFRVGGDEFLAMLPSASMGTARSIATSIVGAVHDQNIEYRRRDDPTRTTLEVNAVVFRPSTAMLAVPPGQRTLPASEWLAYQIYEYKLETDRKAGVVVEADASKWSPKA